MTLSTPYILSLFSTYKYGFLFPVLVVEGPIATILAAFLASPAGGHVFQVVPVFFIVFTADITGDTIYYLIGRYGKGYFVRRYPKRFSIDPEKMHKIERYYKAHGVKTIALGKVSHGLGWPVMVGAGSSGMSYVKFLIVNTAISIPKSLFLIILGFYYGVHYDKLAQYLGNAGLIITTAIFVFVVYLLYRKYSKKEGLI